MRTRRSAFRSARLFTRLRAPLLYALLTWSSQGAVADELSVSVANRSQPITCAEKDNVDLEFSAPDIGTARIVAVHPAYIEMLRTARDLPDFSGCVVPADPKPPGEAERKDFREDRVTFWENSDFWLVGYRHPSFWRPASVPVRVGDKVFQGFDLIQLWARDGARAEQVGVLYPPDGYWRIRPLSPPNLQWSSYGSSFLLGPIEMAERPIVVLSEVAFEPQTRSFVLTFARGGTARLSIATVNNEKFVIDATLDAGVPRGGPFLALRSMYTKEANADVARVGWRDATTPGWQEEAVLRFPGARAQEVWAGRTAPSNHNIAAPDMVFGPFQALAHPAKP